MSSMSTRPPEIYTIGHGNRALEEFTAMLLGAHVGCLVDVRAFPGSRRHPQFGRAELERSMPAVGIEYVWEGAGLGGRRRPRRDSPHVALRNASFGAYADHMESDTFREGIGKLLERAASTRVAIMCAERLPWQCHRYMISDYLVAHGTPVLHLMDGGEPRSHSVRREARLEQDRLVYDVSIQGDLGID